MAANHLDRGQRDSALLPILPRVQAPKAIDASLAEIGGGHSADKLGIAARKDKLDAIVVDLDAGNCINPGDHLRVRHSNSPAVRVSLSNDVSRLVNAAPRLTVAKRKSLNDLSNPYNFSVPA